ncbi:MAG: oligosaccharide flippase family protein [Saprospiraceae bacterium]|nr:oligosaccharide flippase family protein [Saprospiraceae bacterium]HMW38538.1 oligosaccharide flippase family protein [Saprospiraceae bacterium]HMX88576.1 oligosaccharide flippase family protein [Saprospiraceae bacterium]HMZ40642.1 oligosaccharide flippase family protein [Saprospiraceae bacterium]HNA63219.1 oligosaccharide flippase family protein [Saprospiraceae bacterium]
MGVVRKQGFYNSLFVYLSMFIGYINLLILMPSYFSEVQIGMTRSILAMAVFFAQIAELGSSSIMYRFFPFYKSHRARDFLTLVSVIPLLGFFIFCLVGFLFSEQLFGSYFKNSPELEKYLPLVFYLTFFTLVSAVGTNFCVVQLKTVFPKAINEFIPKVGNTILIVLYAARLIDFEAYFFWFCSLTTITALSIWIYIWYLGELKYTGKISKITKRMIRSIIKFGGVAILGSSFTAVISYIDTIMLGWLRGQAEVASFSIGYYLISIMSVPFTAIITVVIPLVSSAIRHKQWGEVLRHYRQTSLNNFIIGAFIFGLLLLIYPEMAGLTTKQSMYSEALYVILFLGVGRLLDMITGCNAEIIVLSRHYMFNFYSIVIVSLLKILLNLYFIRAYGVAGVAITGLVSLILFNASRYWYIYHKLGIQPFTSQTPKAIALMMTCFVLAWIFLTYVRVDLVHHRYFTALSQIIFKSLVWTIICVPPIILLKISPEVNSFYTLLKNKILYAVTVRK